MREHLKGLSTSKEVKIIWSLKNELSLFDELKKINPKIEGIINYILELNSIPIQEELNDFKSDQLERPAGSRRAFYWYFSDNENVIAVKGTEIISNSINEAFKKDSLIKLPNRPWTTFENFIYREQKAPLAMLLNEAKEEAEIGIKYQKKIFNTFGHFEEAPIPIIVFKWHEKIIEDYKKKLEPFLEKRAKELIFPLIDFYGIGGVLYYFPYLPTRIRFKDKKTQLESKKNNFNRLASFNKLIEIQSRMLLADFLPFSFEDHGIGQCIAPQNVTLRGGICDLGSIKEGLNNFKDGELFDLLRSLGVILVRTSWELLCNESHELIYEFDNPTTYMYFISSLIHNKIKKNINEFGEAYSIQPDLRVKKFYESEDKDILKILNEGKLFL